MKAILWSIFFSLIIVLLWGLGLLNYSSIFSSLASIFVSVAITLFFLKYLRISNQLRTRYFLLLFPTLYIILLFVLRGLDNNSFSNPLIPAYFTYIALVLPPKRKTRILFLSILLALNWPYFAIIYPNWLDYKTGNQLDLKIVEQKTLVNNNLNDFEFLTLQGTVRKLNSNTSIIIETWQEDCKPCIESMEDLRDLLTTKTSSTQHYYLYIPKARDTLNFEMLRQFKYIRNKESVLIDANRDFARQMGLNGVPHFLKFCNNGDLCDYFTGYNRRHKKYFQQRIIGMLE